MCTRFSGTPLFVDNKYLSVLELTFLLSPGQAEPGGRWSEAGPQHSLNAAGRGQGGGPTCLSSHLGLRFGRWEPGPVPVLRDDLAAASVCCPQTPRKDPGGTVPPSGGVSGAVILGGPWGRPLRLTAGLGCLRRPVCGCRGGGSRVTSASQAGSQTVVWPKP